MKENFEEATSFENAEILRQQEEIRKLREEIRLLEKLAKLRSVANQLGVGDEDERVAPVQLGQDMVAIENKPIVTRLLHSIIQIPITN